MLNSKLCSAYQQLQKLQYYDIFTVSEYCEQRTGQSVQCINIQQLSQLLNPLNKRDMKRTYYVSTLAFNMIIFWQLSPATSCQFMYRVNTIHLATTHTHGEVATGSNKHMSDKIRTT
jgi:hypothetical protein